MRPRDPAELADLAGPATPHLRDGHLRVGLDPGQREREPDLVVVALLGGDRAQMRPAERGQDVLRRRLARRAGDADDPRPGSFPDGAPERRHGREGIVRHERRRGAALERRADVVGAAADGDEEIARAGAARVDLDAGDGLARPVPARGDPGTAARSRRAGAGSRGGPGGQRAQRVLRLLPVGERHGAAGLLLPLLVTLPGDHDDVAG